MIEDALVVGGLLYASRIGRGGHPIAAPWQNPVSMSTIRRVWTRAREEALTPDEAHAGAGRPCGPHRSLVIPTTSGTLLSQPWLSAGLDSTQVAAWAGHSVAVLMSVYASSLHGHQAHAMHRIEVESVTK